MKKFLIATNILLLAGLIFFAYKFYGTRPPLTGIDTNTIEKKKCYPSCEEYINRPWEGRINGYLAKMMATEYVRDNGKKFICQGTIITNRLDARSAWFPLETIKRYICEIERKTCESKCKDTLGLRIYFAKYPAFHSSDWADLGPGMKAAYEKHHTLFMVPTYWDRIRGVNADFDPWRRGCRMPIDTLPTAFGGPIFLIGGEGDAQNHGSLIPPDEPTGTIF